MFKLADVPEWLTGLTRNQLGYARAGSNPAVRAFFSLPPDSRVPPKNTATVTATAGLFLKTCPTTVVAGGPTLVTDNTRSLDLFCGVPGQAGLYGLRRLPVLYLLLRTVQSFTDPDPVEGPRGWT
ncbi:unnamed protein product [Calypogeia fissa]